MNTRPFGFFQCFGGVFDIAVNGAGQTADGAFAYGFSHRLNGGKIARRGGGKTGFDHIDAHFFQRFTDADLFFFGHGRAGALLAIAHCRIKNNQTVLLAHTLLHCRKNQAHSIRLISSYGSKPEDGNCTFTVQPPPGVSVKLRMPLWRSTIRNTIDNPRPAPASLPAR